MPPSSRIGHPEKGKFYKGWQYDAFVGDIHEIPGNLSEYFPNYKDQGREVSGFCWWQGHEDGGLSRRYYESHLVNDLRGEFKAPKGRFGGLRGETEGEEVPRGPEGADGGQ